MTDNDWVKSAMDDNDLVVHILLSLRQSSSPPPPPPPPPPGWTVRQRRSRPQTAPPPPAKKSASTRVSPATPLSWSGNTSVSGGGGDGVEESSRPVHHRSDFSRSNKVMPPSETTPTKRPRKKKTLAELKEEEMLLLKERIQLKRQLATLQATCEKQRKENDGLKKMKMDVQTQPQEGGPVATQQLKAFSLLNDGFEAKKDVVNEREANFVLPDLNIPAGEDIRA